MSRPTRRRAPSRGSASIEVVVLAPILILVALLTLQLGVAGWTASQTEEAARQAARAQSLGEDPASAAKRSLPGALRVADLDATGDTVTLKVDVPVVSILPGFSVTRRVSMPATP